MPNPPRNMQQECGQPVFLRHSRYRRSPYRLLAVALRVLGRRYLPVLLLAVLRLSILLLRLSILLPILWLWLRLPVLLLALISPLWLSIGWRTGLRLLWRPLRWISWLVVHVILSSFPGSLELLPPPARTFHPRLKDGRF